jgi:hypothetical protein
VVGHASSAANLRNAPAATVQSDLCGADSTAERGGRLLERHLTEVAQQNDTAHFEGQPAHSREQALMSCPAVMDGFGR